MSKLGWIGLIAGAMVVGCAPPPRVLVTMLPSDQKGIAVFVEEPKLALNDTDCRADLVGGDLSASMRQALLVGGYRVVTRPDAADVSLTLGASVADCSEQTGRVLYFDGNITVSVEQRGSVLLEAHRGGWGDCGANGECIQNWPAAFTNELTKSLAANGIHPGGAQPAAPPPATQAAVASLPAAPPAQTSAAPQSATPPQPAGLSLRAGQQRPNAYALVIGIEKYRDAPAPLGARTDAEHFAELARTTLGVPADHVIVALDDRATKSDIENKLGWLSNNVPVGGRIYFYFAGHGAPEATSASAYLLPHDGDPKAVAKTGIPVSTIMSELSATKAQDVVAFVDTCYSGAGGRSVLPPGARALAKVVEPSADKAPRVALFSSAGASEISGPVPGGNEGLFTHLLVEGIGSGSADVDGDGNISLGETALWVKPRVAREAKKDSRDQTPTLTVGKAAGSPDALILVNGIVK